ncbi:unnamed protein product [Fraxinus pennsylvanica]|uniref:Uncharacterized protein n=1 Tax=Fraxinus pennsylvanica TaxID=56036 RepID=A0AAD2DWP6_9LAMI|nr:unnamed protein product [Fraxinus pennsylvanica]
MPTKLVMSFLAKIDYTLTGRVKGPEPQGIVVLVKWNAMGLWPLQSPCSGSGQCASACCIEDVNQKCPSKLRIDSGFACKMENRQNQMERQMGPRPSLHPGERRRQICCLMGHGWQIWRVGSRLGHVLLVPPQALAYCLSQAQLSVFGLEEDCMKLKESRN